MLIIVLYHAGLFWSGNWFSAITPAESAPVIDVIVKWMATFHIYAFTLISGFIYYYVRYERGGYNDGRKFVSNKLYRLIIPYIFVAVLWVIPLNSLFFSFNVNNVINKFLLGEAPSQLWFLLMLFWVFVIAYPLSDLFNSRPIISAMIVIIMWICGTCLAKIAPDIFQIFNSLRFMPFFLLGFELRRNWNRPIFKTNLLNYSIIAGG